MREGGRFNRVPTGQPVSAIGFGWSSESDFVTSKSSGFVDFVCERLILHIFSWLIVFRLKALFLLATQNSWHVLMRVKKQFMALDQKIQRVIYIVLLIIIFGIGTRLYSYWQAKMHSDALSVQLVSTIHPTLGGAESTLSFPGRLDP